jgi:hypothetical protein
MLEVEEYYGVDEVTDVEMWKREYTSHLVRWLRRFSKLTGNAA